MKIKLIEFPDRRSSPPHCCIVTGRRDGQIVDLGLMTAKAAAVKNPHLYLRAPVVEEAARAIGMEPKADVDALRQELAECDDERKRLAAIVAGSEDLSAAEGKLRAALGPSQADPGDATATAEEKA